MEYWKETEEAIEQVDRGENIGAEEVFSWLDTWGEQEEGRVNLVITSKSRQLWRKLE